MPTMPVTPTWTALRMPSPGAKVDREARVLRGYVVALRGPFKSEGRGSFDDASLATIVQLMNAQPLGLKSRFSHPTMSDDGLGSFLGRARNARLDGDRVRADLHLDPAAFSSPRGNLGQYVLDLAESDPDALSSSLVLQADREEALGEDGRRKLDADGKEVPPVWRPTKLHASDVVDTGDAVDGLLSAGIDPDGLPLGALWKGSALLDQLFPNQPREVVEARATAWLGRCLDLRYGGGPGAVKPSRSRGSLQRLRLMEMESRTPALD